MDKVNLHHVGVKIAHLELRQWGSFDDQVKERSEVHDVETALTRAQMSMEHQKSQNGNLRIGETTHNIPEQILKDDAAQNSNKVNYTNYAITTVWRFGSKFKYRFKCCAKYSQPSVGPHGAKAQ